ncbi:MAG: MipA/OmpV family protein [Gammaproteobacteria bacterium]|nr:MipA/OmpV family protein [Gammaproteobacteria bacterium]
MKRYRNLVTMLAGVVLVGTVWSLGRLAQAADIAHEVRQGAGQSAGFGELGLAASIHRIPIVGLSDNEKDPADASLSFGLLLNGMIEWRGFFAEAIFDSFGGIALGYRLYEDERRSLEFVLSNTLAELTTETEGFETIEDRDADLVAGLRSSFYLPNSIIQVSLLSDVLDTHGGFSASAQWGRFWQVRNWNLHAMVGARYFSNKLTDYYFGVSPAEVSAMTPLYTAGGGTMAEFELGATLPLKEDWIFRTGVQLYQFPDAIADSPLTLKDQAYLFNNSINYVF